jgi:hypothetical protein
VGQNILFPKIVFFENGKMRSVESILRSEGRGDNEE